MNASLKPLDQQVIVITGASSGIGLATAQSAASKGASVVLAARSGQALQNLATEIKQKGGDAIAIACDVSRREDVVRLATEAITRFGRIDTWVNNAGLGLWGRLDQVTEDDSRRLFDINFWGIYHGSLIALPYLKQNGGALINVGSEVSEAVVPLQGMYSATKHAVKGFTDALRIEICEVDKAPVSITLIQPTAVDTPFPQHARNYTEKEPMLPPPMIDPQQVADAILDAAVKPTHHTKVGLNAKLHTAAIHLVPAMFDKMAAKQIGKQNYDEVPRNVDGSLYAASEMTNTHVVAQTHGTGGREPR